MTKLKKLDLYREHRSEYVMPKKPVLIEVAPARYLAIDGRGAPGGAVFEKKLAALYNVAFTIKMAKKVAGQDYGVCKPEGLWPDIGKPSELWNWTLLIRTPAFITSGDLKAAIRKLKDKGKPPEAGEVRLQDLKEGRAVQVLHTGPYDREEPTVDAMRKFADSDGLRFTGLHHEIYLSDPRRVAPAKLRTILRPLPRSVRRRSGWVLSLKATTKGPPFHSNAVLAIPLLDILPERWPMTTLQRCLELLDGSRICYAHTKHSLAFTALEVAFAEHISPHKLAKTVVYAGAQGYGLAVLSADYMVDLKTLGAFLNDPSLRMASEQELGDLFPECELGAMPPFGNLFHLPVLVDTSVVEQEFIAFNGGTHRDVIHMSYGDFARLVNPAVAKFADRTAFVENEELQPVVNP